MGHAVQREGKDRTRPGALAGHDGVPARSAAQRVVRGILLLGTGLGLSACTVGPNFAIPPAPQVALTPKPLKAPGSAGGESQRFVTGLDIPGAWWMLFRSRPLSNLMERALHDNFDLKAAQAVLRVAHANVEAQRGAFFPTINGSYMPSRQKAAIARPSTDRGSNRKTRSACRASSHNAPA